MGDNGRVPDSIECSKIEYDNWVRSQPVIPQVDDIYIFEDVATGEKHTFKRINTNENKVKK